jgi:hypothetical protein
MTPLLNTAILLASLSGEVKRNKENRLSLLGDAGCGNLGNINNYIVNFIKKYRITNNINIYWLLLIRTAWLHVSTGYLVIARPVRYKKINRNRNLILYLD